MSNYLINGEETDQVSATDRGLHYGDGVFETLKVDSGIIQYWNEHVTRLQQGCQRLRLPEPDFALLKSEAEQLISKRKDTGDVVLKIIITRGSGQRGYKLPTPQTPNRILAIYPFPDYPESNWVDGVKATICKTRLACNRRLAGIKHLFETIGKAQKYFNPDLKILGIVINQSDGRRLVMETEMEHALRDTYGDLVFKNKINKRVKIEESPAFQKSIVDYRPEEQAAAEFCAFTKELLQRIKTLEHELPSFEK